MYEEREYVIFNVSEFAKVNFSEVLETSEATARKSIDETKAFVKWDGVIPSFVETLTTREGPYTHSQILSVLSTAEWSSNQE